jgi:hypothetical protein
VPAHAFLTAVAGYLEAADLAPSPALIGVVEAAAADELPAVVLSLEAIETARNGVGARATLITDGALPTQASIDLASPVLPEEPAFSLLSADRLVLTLPHGGLVRHDGSPGPLTAADITVSVSGTPRPLAAPPPSGDQVSVDPLVGRLTFAAPLPATGLVQVGYVLGQWEQRIERLAGTLRVDACAVDGPAAAELGAAVAAALLAPAARRDIVRLLSIGVASLSSVGAPEGSLALRRRTARFPFVFEQEINRPESSGGVILTIPVAATPG